MFKFTNVNVVCRSYEYCNVDQKFTIAGRTSAFLYAQLFFTSSIAIILSIHRLVPPLELFIRWSFFNRGT